MVKELRLKVSELSRVRFRWVSPSWFWREGGFNGCACFLCPVASGATPVWPRRYPPRRPRWTGPSGVWMTSACRCPLIWLTSSTEWSHCSGGGPDMLKCGNVLMYALWTCVAHKACIHSQVATCLFFTHSECHGCYCFFSFLPLFTQKVGY